MKEQKRLWNIIFSCFSYNLIKVVRVRRRRISAPLKVDGQKSHEPKHSETDLFSGTNWHHTDSENVYFVSWEKNESEGYKHRKS